MDPLDVSVLVSLVKPGGSRWTVEASIVTRLAQLRGGGWCWAAQAAEWTGADEVVCRRALLSLDRRKLIRRDPGDSGRDNIRWCAVNDDWRRWQVQWLVDASQVAAQLALAAQQRDESPLTRVFARSLSARSLGRIARSFDARSWEADLDEITDPGPGAPSDRAIRIARSLGRRRPALERAIRGGTSQQWTSAVAVDGKKPPPVASGARIQQQRIDVLNGGWVKTKILQRSIPGRGRTAPFLNGDEHLGMLADLLERHTVVAVGKLVEIDVVTPHEYPANIYLEQLRDVIDELTAGGLSLVDHLTSGGHLGPPPDADLAAALTADFERAGANVEGLKGAASTYTLDQVARWQDEAGSGEDPEAIAQ